MNILVVHDSRAMRMIVKSTLRAAGFGNHTVTEAVDGATEFEAIKIEAPDVVMWDWSTPKMNGIELLEALNAEGGRRKAEGGRRKA